MTQCSLFNPDAPDGPSDPESLTDTLRRHLASPAQPITPRTHGDAVAGTLIGLATEGDRHELRLAAIREIFDRVKVDLDAHYPPWGFAGPVQFPPAFEPGQPVDCTTIKVTNSVVNAA